MDRNTTNPYLQTAVSIALRICRDAIWDYNRCNWIGCSTEDYFGQSKIYTRSLSTSFYDGIAGVAYFLTKVYTVFPDPVIRRTAQGAIQAIIALQDEDPAVNRYGQLGFFTGYPGEAFVLHEAGIVFHQPAYHVAAYRLLTKMRLVPESDWTLDIIDGIAGTIPALLQMRSQFPELLLDDFIHRIAGHLKAKAAIEDNLYQWDTMPGSTHPLTGFAHGAAGIATAFMELYAVYGNPDDLEIAMSAFRYENQHFNAAQKNWPDFRNHNHADAHHEGEACGMAWCHGAPGILLSRLRAYELFPQDEWLHDIDSAIHSTLHTLDIHHIGNYSLCHGLFGNAEPLLYAADVLQRADLFRAVENMVQSAIAETFSKGKPANNGLHTPHDTPDFMLGSSGMGYFMLRMFDRHKFPGLLLLRPATKSIAHKQSHVSPVLQ